MFECPVCGCLDSRIELVKDVFQVEGRYVLVHDIPATVCSRCGEESFSSETAERIRLLVNGDGQPSRTVDMDVFEFA